MNRATDVEDLPLPESLSEAPGTHITGGGTFDPGCTIRLDGPPGTGKTTEIAKRLGYLIEEENTHPSDITVVTYRTDLADAVENRLREWGVLGEDIDDEDLRYWTTIHAAAQRTTRVLEDAAAKQQKDEILGPAVAFQEKLQFCSEINVELTRSENGESGRGELLLDLIGYAKNNLLDVTDQSDAQRCPQYDELVGKWSGVDIEAMDETYESWKDRNDYYDFNQILEIALESDKTPPTDVVVIDEYHDMTPLMALLGEKWIEAADTAIIAGDPKQVVNGFRGADPRFFTERLSDIPRVLLDTTYRVPEEHWQAATRMLRAEVEAPPVRRETRGRILEYKSPDFSQSDEGVWKVPGAGIPGSPGALVEQHIDGHDDRSILFLTRTQTQAEGVSAALDKAGIPHDAQDDVGGWSDLRVNLFNAIQKLKSIGKGYAEGSKTYGLNKYTTDDDSDSTTTTLTPLEAAALLDHTTTRKMEIDREEATDETEGLREKATRTHPPDVEIEYINDMVTSEYWQTYTRGSRSVSDLCKNGELDDEDMDAIRATLKKRSDPIDDDQLVNNRVLTIHASKGSEATDVVIYDGITQTIATEMDRSEDTRENEARTWYVGLTRASERLHLLRGGFQWMIPHLPTDIRTVAERSAEKQGGEV